MPRFDRRVMDFRAMAGLSAVARAVGWPVVVVVAACSSSASRPPDLGDCTGIEAGCPATVGGGGGTGGSDSGTGMTACEVSTNDSQCTQCADMNCCTPFDACVTDKDCDNLLNCEQACGGLASCVASCEQQSPNGVAGLGVLTSCIDTKCVVCTESGVGDPCDAIDEACNVGLTCSGLWCTKACARSTDCVGLGAGGASALNIANVCIVSPPAGDTCVPGCSVDADCAAFPGTFCFATTSIENVAVRVCSVMPTPTLDAGRD